MRAARVFGERSKCLRFSCAALCTESDGRTATRHKKARQRFFARTPCVVNDDDEDEDDDDYVGPPNLIRRSRRRRRRRIESFSAKRWDCLRKMPFVRLVFVVIVVGIVVRSSAGREPAQRAHPERNVFNVGHMRSLGCCLCSIVCIWAFRYYVQVCRKSIRGAADTRSLFLFVRLRPPRRLCLATYFKDQTRTRKAEWDGI